MITIVAMVALLLAGAALVFSYTQGLQVRSFQTDLTNLLRLQRNLQTKVAELESEELALERRLTKLEVQIRTRHLHEARPEAPSLALEEERPAPADQPADPRVFVEKIAGRGVDRVILSNRSQGVAHDVYLEVDCRSGRSPFHPAVADRAFPIEELRSGVPFILLATFADDCPSPVRARLRWTDPDGRKRSRQFDLTWSVLEPET